MNSLKSRRIKHYLRLNYPLRVVAQGAGFAGDYPDLPGCSLDAADLASLYAAADAARRQWITERVLTDASIPLPNSYLQRRNPSHDRSTTELAVGSPG